MAFVNSTKEKAMSDQLSLTVINNSDTDPVFAVFANLPNESNYATLNLAWLLQKINHGGNNYTFTWETDWAFTWSAMGTNGTDPWKAHGKPLSADPNSNEKCAAVFGYDGDFTLDYGAGKSDGKTLRIKDTSQVPTPHVKVSSVGLALNGSPICATQAGPNLRQAFTLHPTYYIDAGTYQAGQMVDTANTTEFQVIEYQDSVTALTATLNMDNTWVVEPSKQRATASR
jgi:hypothetical protein